MKAIVYEAYGPPAVLQVQEVPEPEPASSEIKIKIYAAEATKSDCELRSFHFPVNWFWLPLRLVMGLRKPRNPILGGYFAGEVVQIGASVTRYKVGDKVYGAAQFNMGAYGEYLCLPETHTIVAKPENLSYAEAAAVPLGGLNAIHFMRKAAIQPGDKVLINGAGASIGTFAVQIAKSMGAEVTAVDSGIKEAMLRNVGVDHFVNYQTHDFTRTDQQYDVVFSMVATTSVRAVMRVLKPGGRYLTANPRLGAMLASVVLNRLSDKKIIFAFAGETQEELLALKGMIEAGTIAPVIDTIYPPDQAPEAHQRVETEQRLGVVVLQITRE